jgi:hypothetical protein
VLPHPQRITLNADFRFGPTWGFERKGVGPEDIAVTSFHEGLSSRFHIASLRPAQGGGTVTLALAPGSVAIGDALDSDKQALARQAYQIDLAPTAITITANAAPGLFYGVQTLLQLIKARDGAFWLHEGRIVDWPDLRLRQIYWDDAHHLERPEALRNAIRQAAFYKINGFIIKLEGHFQYKSAPAIVEPHALSPAELQSLTDYALKRHVQLMPFLDGPSHIAFILKHPEYAKLREFPDSNYEACAVNPDTYRMYEGLFQDLLNANRGGKYFYLSTDEACYVGLSNNPQTRQRTGQRRQTPRRVRHQSRRMAAQARPRSGLLGRVSIETRGHPDQDATRLGCPNEPRSCSRRPADSSTASIASRSN